jgi:hypothetical protein
MSLYKCSSCNALILNGSIHGCYDVTNRMQPNNANQFNAEPPQDNSSFYYEGTLSGALSTYGPGPSGSTFGSNQMDPFVAGAGSASAPLGRFPQPQGSGPANLQYEPVPSMAAAEAASVTYNGKPKNTPVAYQTESGAVSGQAVGGMF